MDSAYTYPFVGHTVCKVAGSGRAAVLDFEENTIGTVLTCVTDMGIGWHGEKIYSSVIIWEILYADGIINRGLSGCSRTPFDLSDDHRP
jgi:hypothetical protein